MANEDALVDRNFKPSLIVADEVTGEIRLLKGTLGGLKVAGRLEYLGAEVITGSPVAATIPSGTTVVVVQASTVAVTFTIDAAYDAGACGYLAIGGQIKIGPLDSLTNLNLTSAGNIHLMYFKEA